MLDEIVEVEIVQPGRSVGQYELDNSNQLYLEKILYPETSLPFDLAILPKTLTSQGENLQALLLGTISHPPQTRVDARLLGAFQVNGTFPIIMAVPVADEQFSNYLEITDIPEKTRKQLIAYVNEDATSQEKFCWLNSEKIISTIRDAYINFRKIKTTDIGDVSDQPDWKPTSLRKRAISYTEAEHYTPAEYTFFQLPYRFQHYVERFLAEDERILYALLRPSMRSRRYRSILGRKTLQEGVVILTNQRLINLVELIPPDRSGIRYGYDAQMGVVERIASVSTERLGEDVILLQTQWSSSDGVQTLEWEFPMQTWTAVNEISTILKGFIPDSIHSRSIRRVTLPPLPDSPPSLRDPAANTPLEINAINERFKKAIPKLIRPNEKNYAWALWPAWFENRGYPEVLLITDSRILIVSEIKKPPEIKFDLSLRRISTLKYVASILESYIELSLIDSDESRQTKLNFPYPSEKGFRTCLEAIRRCMAVLPI